MSSNSQKRALRDYRLRLSKRGMSRFEVLGLDSDKSLIRSLARRLAEDSFEAERIRATLRQAVGSAAPRKGGILEALRRSPLVGADFDVSRPREAGRKVEL